MQSLATTFELAALLAGRAIMRVHAAGTETHYKADCSPVTEADEQAEAIILAELAKHCPHIPVVAEESVAAGRTPNVQGQSFILVDPLDGTKEFISGSTDFTVNIALIEDGFPILGVVYAPALQVAYLGSTAGVEKLTIDDTFAVVERKNIIARRVPANPICVASRSHNTPETENFIRKCGASDIRAIGSSLKFCLLAEGAADLYPRFGRTMEWDTAAGDAVLRAAGGTTLDLQGEPLRYGKLGRTEMPDFANSDFVAWGIR
jgi:3'(2'), 5'-bisphosphate nucleotidase